MQFFLLWQLLFLLLLFPHVSLICMYFACPFVWCWNWSLLVVYFFGESQYHKYLFILIIKRVVKLMFLSTWGNWMVTFFGFFLSAHHRQNGVRKMNSCKYCSNLNAVINFFSFLSCYYCCLSKAATSFTFTLLLVLSYHSYKGQQGPCSPRLSQKHSTGRVSLVNVWPWGTA